MADKQGIKAAACKRRYYLENKDKYIRRNKLKRARMNKYIRELKSNPCMDCGKKYPFYAMDFDHRDPSKKVSTVSQLVADCSWQKLKDEIEKCDLVCSNCHRLRTYGKK